MKAMILAAGLGKRMQPLTNSMPKPLLKVGGRYLIEYHLEKLAKAGIKEVVVNTHWLAEKIPEALGDGQRWGLKIYYSYEPELLETAGGIRNALPNLVDDSDVFLLINGDVFFDWDLSEWLSQAKSMIKDNVAYLALVPNPQHHLAGDFYCQDDTHILSLTGATNQSSVTYSGIGLYKLSFFSSLAIAYQPLGPLLKEAIEHQMVLGGVEDDFWLDVGTPERLQQLDARLRVSSHSN